MKKILSLLLVCVIMFSFPGSGMAAASNDEIIYTLAGYDIIDANTPNNMNETVSRGEFANIVARLMGVSERSGEYIQTNYYDVPGDYIYAADISALNAMGILNGYSETIFAPNDSVTYEQALKVLVLIIGYGKIAQADGGWPEGYIRQASRADMIGGVSLTNPFSRGSLYRLIYNALDINLVDEVFTTGPQGTLEKTDSTLRDKLSGYKGYELYRHTGVISANSYTYTTAPYSDLYDDEVVIDNRSVGNSFIYKIGKTNAFELVGCEVEFYAHKTDSGYELLSVKPTANNELLDISADDLGMKDGRKIYYTAGKKSRHIELDGNYKVVYNGNRIITPTADVFEINDGYVRFINNDSDNDFELALVWEYENAIATSFDGRRMNFATDAQFNSLTSIDVNPENKDVKLIVIDKNGSTVESFDTEKTVSVFANSDRTRYRIIVSDDVTEGIVSGMSDEYYTIGETDYIPSSSLGTVRMGLNYRFYIDYQGKLAFAKENSDINYGYILQLGSKNGRYTKVDVQMLIPGKVDAGVETNDEDVTDTSAVPYLILQNEAVQVMRFADRVKCQGERYSGKALYDLLITGRIKAVSYKLNSDGEISEITPLEKCGGDITKRYQYDVYDRVFGGATVDPESGFAIDYDTKAVCVPADDSNNINYGASEDDLNVKINITVANNDVGYRVEGYDYDDETKKARFLVTFATMDSTAALSIDAFSSKASVVTSSKFVLNEESGGYEKIFEVLQGESSQTLYPMHITSSNATIERVKAGDLITFTTNSNDRLENAYIIQSLPDLISSSDYEYVSGTVKKSLGKAGKIEYDEVDTYNKALVTRLELYTGGSVPRVINIKQKNTPPVYIYDTDEGVFEAASLKEIVPENDRVFVFERSGDALVRAVVIIR